MTVERTGGVLTLLALAGGLGACGPRTGASIPGGGPDATETRPDAAPAAAECERMFAAALAARTDRVLAAVDGGAVRAAVLRAILQRMQGDARLSAAGRRLVEAVAGHPAVRQQITDALVQSAADPGALAALGSALLSGGGDPRDRVERALAGSVDALVEALVEAADRATLAERMLALPEVRGLLGELLPDAPFETAMRPVREALAGTRAAQDARLRWIVPGDPEATREAVDRWAARPPPIGCRPVARSLALGAAAADLASVRDFAATAAERLAAAPAVQEESVALVRDLMADAGFRLALDELLVRGLREESHDRLVEAALPVLGSPAVPRAVAAWAARLASRRAELPDLRDDLERVAADPQMGDLLLRLLDVLVLSEGCVELSRGPRTTRRAIRSARRGSAAGGRLTVRRRRPRLAGAAAPLPDRPGTHPGGRPGRTTRSSPRIRPTPPPRSA